MLYGRRLDDALEHVDGSRYALVHAVSKRARQITLWLTADPAEFWQPIDNKNERWLELALFPGRRYPPEDFPSFEQLNAERDRMRTKLIGKVRDADAVVVMDFGHGLMGPMERHVVESAKFLAVNTQSNSANSRLQSSVHVTLHYFHL